MAESPTANRQSVQIPEDLTPLDIIRTETVLSRLPIHQLSKSEVLEVNISRKNKAGKAELLWKVSPNAEFGHPRQLAYRIDKLIIDRQISELGRPIPKVILLQSLRHICRELGINERRGVKQVKDALNQNAGAFIQAQLSYKGRDGRVRKLSGGFTRYGVFFIGDTLPGDDAKAAENVYIVLNEPYWTVLNNALDRPIDYDYFKSLREAPSAQRWYEIASYKLFAALQHQRPEARLLYSEYCTFSAQKRRSTHTDFVKHMYVVHKLHLKKKYIQSVRYERITDEDGALDWIIHYTPGARAYAQFTAFNSRKSSSREVSEGKDGTQESLGFGDTGTPGAENPAELVRLFYKKMHNLEAITPVAKSLKQAQDLITQHGFAKAQFIINFGCERAQESNWKPDNFGGLLQYVPQALGTYEKIERLREREEIQQREEKLQAAYEEYRSQEIERVKSELSAEELTEIEREIRGTLEAEGTFPSLIGIGVHMKLNAFFEGRAGVLSYEEWRKQET